jgi:class 3 adenylate cyclase
MPACRTCGKSSATDARFCPHCGASLAPPAVPTRKTVTVLFCDVTNFTPLTERLDPESLHRVMARYFEEMSRAIERHGGLAEKYIGDAVMAVFGAPQLHEDDALRAARCALEMRDSLEEVNRELRSGWGVTLHARYGLATGEVAFAGVGHHAYFALGDPVNVAQRLETAAPVDEVLVCAQTAWLLRDVAVLEPLEALSLKGKAAPVNASKVLAVSVTGDRSGPATRMVGRRDQLDALREAFADVTARRHCRAITVLGEAGVGKSRLVKSFVGASAARATAVVGRCLSYGEGITFWPLAQVVEQLAGGVDEGAIAAVLGDDEQGRWAATRVARAVGSSPGTAQLEEIQLGMRRLLEAACRGRPLILIIEDIHWAEQTLLDVLTHIVINARDVPLLVVCTARPEVLEAGSPVPAADVLHVRPLSEAESGQLLEQLDPVASLDAEERARLLAVTEGNPFFLEQMVAMKHEAGPDAAVPATIQAVLASRIDALPDLERAVVDCAAVEGRQFHSSAVSELLAPAHRSALDQALASLTRRDLVRPGRPDIPGETGYRFAHILIRDAVYTLLPKARRAELHERVARWLAARSVGDRDFREIIGFHFEQAHRHSSALQPVGGAEVRRLGQAGAGYLGTVGRSALARGDAPAAVNLLRRATALLDEDEPALGALLPELGYALTQTGASAEAQRVLTAAADRASARGDATHQAHALVALLSARLRDDTGPACDDVRRRFSGLRATFIANGDDLGLGRLWNLRALVCWLEARAEAG